MPSQPQPNGVFISCVSDEFEKDGAPFPGLRSRLDVYLRKANCHMVVQEVFPQTDEDTVEKLDKLIRERAAVLHLIGAMPGFAANEKAVAAYLKAVPDFLQSQPELKTALGDFSGMTYTQWEAYIALHSDVPLFIYGTEAGMNAQSEHLKRLRLARKYPGSRIAIAGTRRRQPRPGRHHPSGLLTASLYHFVRGEHDLARKYLAEAQQIAERGPMPLFLADIHLHRARMFHDKTELAQAAKLIRDLCYGRRYDELLDAEPALR